MNAPQSIADSIVSILHLATALQGAAATPTEKPAQMLELFRAIKTHASIGLALAQVEIEDRVAR